MGFKLNIECVISVKSVIRIKKERLNTLNALITQGGSVKK